MSSAVRRSKVYMLDAETGPQKATFLPPGGAQGCHLVEPGHGGRVAWPSLVLPTSDAEAAAASMPLIPKQARSCGTFPAESLILPAPVYADGVVYFGSSDG